MMPPAAGTARVGLRARGGALLLVIAATVLAVDCQLLSGVDATRWQAELGATCSEDGACVSGHCVDGVCCDDACARTCESCSLAGSVGRCGAVPSGADPRHACAPASYCDGARHCLGQVAWARTLERPDNDEVGAAMSADASGNLIIGGTWMYQSGAFSSDGYAAKLDRHGNMLWQGTFGSSGSRQRVTALTSDPFDGAIYLGGPVEEQVDFSGPPFSDPGPPLSTACSSGSTGDPCCAMLAHLASNGRHRWAMSWGGASCVELLALAAVSPELDASGGVIAAGRLSGTEDFGTGPLSSTAASDDALLLRLDANGQPLWAQRFGDGEAQSAARLALDTRPGEAALIAAGNFAGSIDLGGGVLQASEDGALFVARLGLDGAHRSSRALGIVGAAGVGAVTVDAAGAVALVGALEGSLDLGDGQQLVSTGPSAFIMRMAPDGSVTGSSLATGTGTVSVAAAVQDPFTSAVYVLGSFATQLDLGEAQLEADGLDGFVWAVDVSGALRFGRRIGGPGTVNAGAIALLGTERLAVTGRLLGGLTVDDVTLQTGARADLFAVALGR